MPPKKQLKIGEKQKRLSDFFGRDKRVDEFTEFTTPADLPSSPEAEKVTESPAEGKNVEGHVRSKKVRTFQPSWLKVYSWLRFDDLEPDKPIMYCQLCTDAKKKNGMVKGEKCNNFQNSTCSRHVELPEHELLVKAPPMRKELDTMIQKTDSKHDEAVRLLLKSVHWLASEDIPLVKFKSLIKFLKDCGLAQLNILNLSKLNYDSYYTASEILDCLSEVVEDKLCCELAASPVVTALADESTDIANHKRLVIYAQLVDPVEMKPSTHFLTNAECNDATGKGIAHSILDEFEKRGVPAEKIMSLGSDGASVMTGKINGCAAVMKRENPHMNNIHCVAHKLALCTSQAAERIDSLKQHQQILTDLFYYFKGSAKRAAKISQIQELVDDPSLTYKEIHSVRWLSYFNALSTVYRTTDSLFTYLADADVKDPKANGLKKKIVTDQFISITYLMMDAMAPVTVLSQFFQTENVDIALVKVKLDLCLSDLAKVKDMTSKHLGLLKDDLPPDSTTYKGQHHITKTPNFNLQKLAEKFVDALVDNVKSRFPEDDLLSEFSVLSMRPVACLTTPQLEEYGNTEIQALSDFYGAPQTTVWKVDGDEHKKTSQPLINPEKTTEEWKLVKKVVVAEHYPRDSTAQLWGLIMKYHGEFPNLSLLAKLALTCSVHTAGCERGFSVQNRILTTFRNRLNVDTQQKLMRVKLDAIRGSFNFEAALLKWKKSKERRIYELKNIK